MKPCVLNMDTWFVNTYHREGADIFDEQITIVKLDSVYIIWCKHKPVLLGLCDMWKYFLSTELRQLLQALEYVPDWSKNQEALFRLTHVLQSAAKWLAVLAVADVHLGDTEIGDARVAVAVDEDVLRFHIATKYGNQTSEQLF